MNGKGAAMGRLGAQRRIVTMAAVVPYAFCALADSLVSARVSGGRNSPRVTIVELVAFVFAMFTLYGCGAQPVLYGLVLLLLGVPVFVWQRRRAGLFVV
jgi:hypothetical protein